MNDVLMMIHVCCVLDRLKTRRHVKVNKSSLADQQQQLGGRCVAGWCSLRAANFVQNE